MNPESRDLLITASETNNYHGVGILLQRLFPDSQEFVCLRTTSLYQSEEPFGLAHHELDSRFLTLKETEEQLRRITSLYKTRRILCVPYYREEFIHAILVKRLTGAPLCTYLMDDQNVYASQVPDHWVAELLDVSDFRLGISPELCAAYQQKYHHQIHLLPPVLTKKELLVPCYWQPEPGSPLRSAMIGNVWTSQRFDELRTVLRATGLHLDWYGKGSQAPWLRGIVEDWEADHIRCMGFLPEEDLVASLASYPFIVVPSGYLDANDDNPAFSRLSLPSRLFFLHAHTDTPVLVLGSAETAAGRFVNQHVTGMCAPSTPREFQECVRGLMDPMTHMRMRKNIRRLSASMILEQAGTWIWDSLTSGRPAPAPFHSLFPADYLTAAPSGIQPARTRPQRIFPEIGENFHDVHGPSFGFIRHRHLPVLRASGLEFPSAAELELSHLNSIVAHYILRGAQPGGGDILFLGPEDPTFLDDLPPNFKIWKIANLPAWQQAGYAGDPHHVIEVKSGVAYPPQFPQFAAIFSTAWAGQLGADPHEHEGLSLYLEACTQPGGINLHLFTAILHPTYFWIGPAHAYLRQRFLGTANWPDKDEMLAEDDLFTMSEQAYDLHWRKNLGKTYTEIGRPLACALYWRKTPAEEAPKSLLASG